MSGLTEENWSTLIICATLITIALAGLSCIGFHAWCEKEEAKAAMEHGYVEKKLPFNNRIWVKEE